MNNAVIKSFEVMSDASGAPAVVQVGGFRVALDMLGDVRASLIGDTYGASPGRRAKAVIAAKAAYTTRLNATVDTDWLRDNREMYQV